ncbi:alpha/beta fold hydrolase [Hymenobacter monticola]|uniref:Alpha/beta hydrolase n=1 Tax=Hymenobacter monticola TaxID=1705399 RepID=A0ABY4B608_9BACT|nr:alpha/beta hydrolase [Hymenobacter monticola]UOE34609.1 alpha/beta hydrolase [Hymenobacter monticola]
MRPALLPLPAFETALHTYEAGDPAGPLVVFVPGNSMGADLFQGQLQAPELQAFRLVALDLPGLGLSPRVAALYAPDRLGAALVAAVETLAEGRPALVVGHSYGGNLLLEELPRLSWLRGLLLLGAPPVGTADLAAAFRFDATGQLLYAPELSAAQAEALAAWCLRADAPAAEQALVAADVLRADGRVRTELAAYIGNGLLRDERAHVAATSVPLAFATGEQERALDFAYFDTLAAPTRWGQSLHLLPGAAHLPFLENPVAFNRLLLAFAAATALP